MADHIRKIKEVDQFISDLPEDLQNITKALRNLILNSSPKLKEEFKWSMPNYSYKGFVCYLQTAKTHVNLGFHKGNALQDKDSNHLLQGTGKTMRYIRIKQMEDIQPEVFTSLIQEAMRLNENE
ncbi:DUF1801 domain-containing protein [Bacillus thermotolerans]|uniref:DUF5655 domain-containing protein n=1 Tax=Bacillus thermotolerans TaxID=1221996 RepID=A0A0F5HN84_BACTR|nr:DUF5655 domain-containing protein [Bacillus thermotolerans]KKB34505.1 hypothetical protein QY95_03856 [Bacillus thermotolerans]KKB41363.1 hypothetical protein QY96_02026 [Bacillus thermotolerans]